ncbi:MAG: hypothetical protein JSU74_08975, partial [Candidatus Zixiibacteriota bacterium]
MDASLGRIKARLAEPAVDRLTELVGLINENVNPPSTVTENDIYIRAMYIVSDQVNSFGGRFPSDELQRLTELLVDSPVMVGHRKDRLPVARTFYAEIVAREGKSWVKSYFYWLRSAKGADDLLDNIDGGIYKECSIGFTYHLPECSICGKDIRRCRHEPFEKYQVGGEQRECHFNYRQIDRVLETSMVYRGAVADTSMSKELIEKAPNDSGNGPGEIVIASPAELALDTTFLVVPFYESVPVLASVEDGGLELVNINGEVIDSRVVERLNVGELPAFDDVYGQLIGYRGKERCGEEQLTKHLAGRGSAVTRLELKLFPSPTGDDQHLEKLPAGTGIGLIRHECCTATDLIECARRLMTKHGVRIWPLKTRFYRDQGYRYRPDDKSGAGCGYYRILLSEANSDAVLEFCHDKAVKKYVVKQFNLPRFNRGCRFVLDRISDSSTEANLKSGSIICGELTAVSHEGDSMVLDTDGALRGCVVIQAIRLGGADRWLMYQPGGADDSSES